MVESFTITTPAFKEGEPMPPKYTYDGENVNPPLTWTTPPANSKSLVLICDDPDAPVGTWTHWLVKDIPVSEKSVGEGKKFAAPSVEVTNSFGYSKYGGPKPPSGTHRYYFKLYALKVEKMKANTKDEFYKEVEKEKIAMAQVMGRYSKK
eukprot:TRINITY_DN3970_c0_g1_i4.p3 TRINITY_DN3970_c0_g1~~TRINITY_DN3970_c0_g1_i4.p3  ORF type:complete len:150 (-),score=44.04 TRINITY_DN3970_c0_g1_i4:30-479(-)